MNDFSTGLTPAETERLALLAEEMGEAQQVIGKILRHGYGSTHPDGGPSNRGLLEKEIAHVRFAIALMSENDDINLASVWREEVAKQGRIEVYLHHNEIPEGLK